MTNEPEDFEELMMQLRAEQRSDPRMPERFREYARRVGASVDARPTGPTRQAGGTPVLVVIETHTGDEGWTLAVTDAGTGEVVARFDEHGSWTDFQGTRRHHWDEVLEGSPEFIGESLLAAYRDRAREA